ncbi:hypothetical protein [Pseudomonas kribbensis]|uniref:hypothetical protein n=1 Tax=Pseudomonas kribbensis TaxID=1628086 RepID=UPI001F3B989D|nr:hypothetical protein [Pseudomonas kribbensis]UIN53872.1 hypothetical protein LXN51_23420 [Pseudomonas kribbensis]
MKLIWSNSPITYGKSTQPKQNISSPVPPGIFRQVRSPNYQRPSVGIRSKRWPGVAWKKAVSVLDLPQSVASTFEVLALAHSGTADAPDQLLSLWSKCLDKTAYRVLAQTLLTAEAIDDGRRRIWRQITSLDPMEAPQGLIDLGMRVLALGSAPETASAVNENLESICVRLTNQESELATAHTLLRTLPRCSSIKIKTNLARIVL